MIHFRKRLNIINIIRSIIFPKKLKFSHWRKNKSDKLFLLSKSTWSILLIGIWCKLKKGKKEIVFLVPNYYCDYSLKLIKILGSKIVFYNINKNFEPEFNSIKSVSKIDIIIATHYFGKEYNFAKLADYCFNKKIWLVEDATHCLRKIGKIGTYGHFTIFSQHKFLSNVNGAILFLNHKKISKEDLDFFDDRKKSFNLLKKFIIEKKISTFNNNFRVLINIIYDCLIKPFKKEKIDNFDNNNFIQNKFPNPKVDYISKKLLSLESNKIGFLSDYRKRCHQIVENYLETIFYKDDFEILSDVNYDPYLLIIKSKFKIREIYHDLKKKGIAVQTWPDLPDVVDKNSDAFFLRNNLIFITLNKISLNLFSHRNILDKSFNVNLIECHHKEKWENLNFNYDTNILQGWEFGNYKSDKFLIKTKRFLIKDNLNNEIGFFQSINYNFLGFKIIFINRGPILRNDFNLDLKKKIIEQIVDILKKNFFTFIFIKPELEIAKESIIFRHRDKLNYFKYPFWRSSKINLLDDQVNIFKKFKNSLKSEISKSKDFLSIHFNDKDENTKWICERYFSDINKKKFKLIDPNLIRYLETEKIISICAQKNQQICSGIIVYCHGKSATYLMSFNTNVGRKFYGNQILLWEAIKYLKNKKYNYLDLGGIDLENNLNVAKFKLAFNGKLYKLVGSSFF